MVWCGLPRCPLQGFGTAWLGEVRYDLRSSSGADWSGMVRSGSAGHGKVRFILGDRKWLGIQW